MARMIDQIRAGGGLAAPWLVHPSMGEEWRRHASFVVQGLRSPALPVVVIDNVAEYYYQGSDQEHWDFRKDFPNMAPPWPTFWCEHKMARKVHSKERGDTDMSDFIGPNARVGVLVHAADPKNVTLAGKVPDAIAQQGKWFLWIELFLAYDYIGGPSWRVEGMRKENVVAEGPHGSIFMVIDERGALVEKPWMQSHLPQDADERDKNVLKSFTQWLHPTFLAISFLHCKNVKTEDHAMDKPLAKKFRSRYAIEPARWKTLVIEPLKQILQQEGKAGTAGLAKAMHICRGHFRDYREGRGLFGKYHGQFWQPSVVRGTRGKLGPRDVEVRLPPSG
jgi:hypothetical protein